MINRTVVGRLTVATVDRRSITVIVKLCPQNDIIARVHQRQPVLVTSRSASSFRECLGTPRRFLWREVPEYITTDNAAVVRTHAVRQMTRRPGPGCDTDSAL